MTAKGADNLEPKAYFPARFQLVETIVQVKDVMRDPEGAKVSKTGHVLTNLAGSEALKPIAEKAFGDLSKCGVVWGADKASGEVAGKFVAAKTKRITPVRVTKKGLLSFRMAGVFKEHPDLKPETRKWVSLSVENDPEVGTYFVLHLNLALPRATRRRKTQAQPTAS